MCREFSQFLIECETNFVEGLKMKRRADLIDQGVNFSVDHAFKHLVQTYPLYLTKKILDVKGNFILSKKTSKGSSSSSNSSSSRVTINMNEELSYEIEDSLAKASFTYPRMRLAYQRAIENKFSQNNKNMKIVSLISLITAILMIVNLYLRYYSLFDSRYNNLKRQGIVNNIRYGFDAIITTLTIYWANKQGIISDELRGDANFGLFKMSSKSNDHNLRFAKELHPVPDELEILISDEEYSMIDEITRWIIFARKNLDDLNEQTKILAAAGNDVSTTYALFLRKSVDFVFCEKDDVYGKMISSNRSEKVTLQQAMIQIFIKISNVTQVSYKGYKDFFSDKGVCECIVNIDSIIDTFDAMSDSLSNVQIVQVKQFESSNNIYAVTFVFGYSLIFVPAMLIRMFITLKEIKYVLNMMYEVDKTHRAEAARPLKNTITIDENEILSEKRSSYSVEPCFLYSFIVIFGVLVVVIFLAIIFMAGNKSNSFLDINQWQFYGNSRGNYMLEIFTFTLFAVILKKNPNAFRMINTDESIQFSRKMVKTMLDENNYLLRGALVNGTRVHPCIGINKQLDQLNFEDDCPLTMNEGNFHDTYRCASIDRGISIFAILITDILDNIDKVEIKYDQPIYHAFHIVNNHLLDPTYAASKILIKLAEISIDEFHISINGLCFGSIFTLIIFYAFFYSLLKRIDIAFSGAFQLLRRLPPLCVIANHDLLDYLLNKKHPKTNEVVFTSKAVIMNTKDAVFCLNRNQTIEVVNKAVTNLFGYTPEQLLGQPITIIIRQEDCQKLYEQFEYMLNGDSPLLYETKTVGMTDNDQSLNVNATVIGISDGKFAESFVVIIKDVSVLQKQQEEAQAAKKKSEDLLYQILPRDIVNRLNQGEKDISFVVQSATVIFIDIVKFSDYVSSLTPAQIMENLSMVFAGIDAACSKYGLITKIKLIGDVYMAAANLFTEEDPRSHATQVVHFALDVLQAIDDVNTQLNSSLQVRIGVNTDGPLIAGVLGIDKPVFDIIGDPINVAARLQSNGIPGTVQISESTYHSVIDSGFNIEKRGEIMLKGKGKRMAYIVRSNESSIFFSNS